MKGRKSVWEVGRTNDSRASRQDLQFLRLQIGTHSLVNMCVVTEAIRQNCFMFGLSQNVEGSKYFISVYKTREAERTVTFRFQGKRNLGFMAPFEIPLVLEDFRGQSLTVFTDY